MRNMEGQCSECEVELGYKGRTTPHVAEEDGSARKGEEGELYGVVIGVSAGERRGTKSCEATDVNEKQMR